MALYISIGKFARYIGSLKFKWNIPIFGNKNQFASAASVSPEQIGRIIKLERDFGYTLKRNLRIASWSVRRKLWCYLVNCRYGSKVWSL